MSKSTTGKGFAKIAELLRGRKESLGFALRPISHARNQALQHFYMSQAEREHSPWRKRQWSNNGPAGVAAAHRGGQWVVAEKACPAGWLGCSSWNQRPS